MKRIKKKYCRICNVELTPENRYKNTSNLLCKPHYQAVKREHKNKYMKGYNRVYKLSESGKKATHEAQERSRKKFPEKWAARAKLREAVKVGKIMKPDECEQSVGYCVGRIEGHHYAGYEGDNWSKVLWLCPAHHFADHVRMKKSGLSI